MKFFFSCDWGTSTFRLRLVNAENGKVLSEIKTGYGIAAAFEQWKQINQDKKRIEFYKVYLFEQVKKIKKSLTDSFDASVIILSGMASSDIGMLELPYKEMPFKYDGSDLITQIIYGKLENESYKIVIV